MAELADAFSRYLRMIAQSVRAQLQHRVSFLLMAFGTFVASGVEAIGIWALFERWSPSCMAWSMRHSRPARR